MKLKLTLQDDVIQGFSYSFSKALLKKLKELKEKDILFDNKRSADFGPLGNDCKFFFPIGEAICSYLREQLKCTFEMNLQYASVDEIEKLIAVAEDFLSIFEK